MRDTALSNDDRHDVQTRVDQLLSQMTPAEKAGQLTQYFYFRLPAGAEVDPALPMEAAEQPRAVEQALQRARPGRCCSSLIPRRSTGCSGSRSPATASTSRCCSDST